MNNDSMDGMSKEEWRRSMLLNTPDESALEAKLDRLKQFKQKRKESTMGRTQGRSSSQKASSTAKVEEAATGSVVPSKDASNRVKSWKSREEVHKEELSAARKRGNMQREQTRRLPDYLAKTDRPPVPPYVAEYKASVSGGPRGQATVMFEEAEDAFEFATTATKHSSMIALAIPALPEEARAPDKTIKVAELTTAAGKLLPVDRSLLPPLEHFELDEFIEKDKSNEEWLSMGPTTGAVPYYVNDQWAWVSADVLSYDSSEQRFMVRVRGDPGGAKKRASIALGSKNTASGKDGGGAEQHKDQPLKGVARLNLRFDREDPVMFEQRRRAAEEGRRAVITSLRFDKMVMAREISKAHASLVPEGSMVDAIHAFVFDPLPPGLKHELTDGGGSGAGGGVDDDTSVASKQEGASTPNPFWHGRLAEHLGDGVRSFARGVRIGVLRRDIQRSAALRNELLAANLPLPPSKEAAPEFGKILLGPRHVPFDLALRAVEKQHFSSTKEVAFALSWLHRDWFTRQDSKRFVDTSGACLKGKPWPLNDFVHMQRDFCKTSATALREKWRNAFAETVTDCGQQVFDLFVNDLAVLKASPLYALLVHVRLRMALLLRSLVESTASELEALVNAHTAPLAGGETADPGCQCAGSGDGSHSTPLLRADVSVTAEGGAVLVPNRVDTEAALLELVDGMASAARTVVRIDSKVASMVSELEPSPPLLDVGSKKGDPLCSGLDERLARLRHDISSKVTSAFTGPEALAERFGKYTWVLEIATPEYVEDLCSAEPPPSHEALGDKIREFHVLAQTVGGSGMTVAFDEEEFALLRVGTLQCKRDIADKAIEVRDALLGRMVEDLTYQNETVVERYTTILETLAHVPTNEVELASLREFIAATPPTVEGLMVEVASVHEQLELVNEFGFRVSAEDGLLNWSTMTYPAQVKDAIAGANEIQELRQAKLLDELNAQKDSFDKLLERYAEDLNKCKGFGDYDNWEESSIFVNELSDGLQAAKATVADFNAREAVFKFPPTEYPSIDAIEKELDPCFRLWNMIAEFNSNQREWMSGSFLSIDAPKVETDVVDWFKSSAKMAKLLQDEYPRAAECAQRLREVTGDFRKHLPIMVALATPALKQRHWDQLSTLLGVDPIEPNEDLTLEELLEWGVATHIEEIEEISVHANKQFGLEKNLAAMKADWGPIEFEVKDYRTSGTAIIGGLEDITTLLDDHIVKTQTMRGSPFVKGILEECMGWQNQLLYGQEMLDEWVKVQRTWMYLEPIFSSDDIMRQLPTEARRFNDVDKVWRKIMSEAKENPGFLFLATEDKGFKSKFAAANEKLDRVQKGLNDYLEVKRKYFPRFFFLSNDELLEILSQTKDPKAVQPHLGKAFEGISKVKFEGDLKISQMLAAKGEVVVLDEPVDPEKGKNKGNVECWLLELEHMQWRTIKTQTELGLEDYKVTSRNDWTLRWPQQVILAGSSVYWTIEVNDVLNSGGSTALKTYVDEVLNPQLLQIVDLVRGKLNKVQMSTLGALVVIDVHARDTCDVMVDAKVESSHDFAWVSQLRYAWETAWKNGQAVEKGQDTLVCKIVNAKAMYGYEYLGNSMRLVITPLTDRCYRTMIGAIELLYGGAPEGPAGTGKTETVKDLSKAVAIHCVVFNCSDSMDYLQMAKFFKGLAGCGSWCCFDEFNRINVEVLSVIAQQILTINEAKKRQLETFFFEGTTMKLNQNCNAFITMNPGYAGRTELPDNLKALFRPCAMMVPDYALISEIRLYSFGFGEPRGVAQKLVKVLQLSSEQLSSQKHYDYGMRAVQSILVACGSMFEKVGKDPAWTEAKIVLRSVYDVNYPKFTVEDLPLFKGITSDLFPGIELPVADHGPLLACIDEQCRSGVNVASGRDYKMDPIDTFTTKIRELYEMVLVRHGVMVCGETGSGKTVGIHCLKQSLTVCNERGQNFPKVHTFTMNPKSIKSSQLYGNFDDNTHEWSDGILPVLYRIGARDTSEDRNWVIFDGPVDAVWIENMNTVLDDNKKLCLNSGEIIKMTDQMTMMFEAEDLEQASPATISRVGMIFCETRNVGWRPLRNVWLDRLESEINGGEFAEQRNLFEEMFEWIFPAAVFFVQNYCHVPAPVSIGMMCQSVLRLLTCFLNSPEGFASDLAKVCESLFVKALYWSVGGAIDGASREKFDQYLRTLLTGTTDENPAHDNFLSKNRTYDQATFGARKVAMMPRTEEEGCSTIFDLRFDAKKAQWLPWVEAGERTTIPKTATYNSIVVPTVDTVRHEWLMNELLVNGFNILCTGDTGTGKSVSIKNKLINGMDEKYMSIMLNFSAQTGANQTQDIIDGKLGKRRKGVFGPPVGQLCIIFVDDLNMPAKEEYGAQPPVEILRQWMDHAGWYDREETVYMELVDLQFIAAMGPPGGGRTFITQRYVRHFNVLNFAPFSDSSLTRVFSTIVDWFLNKGGFQGAVKSQSASMVKATIDVYNTIALNLLPTPLKSHYLFNLRDISKVFQGVAQGHADKVKDKESIIRLWCHECQRVFSDRLTDVPDREWFKVMLAEKVKEHFAQDFAKVRGENEVLVYGNYLEPGSVAPIYQEVVDRVHLEKVMNEYLDDFNSMTKKPMSLVLFGNAIEHVSRISRVINQPYGNALLVGVGGSGRKSLTTLAVSIADFKIFEITINSSYGVTEWKEDMKIIMKLAGEKNQPTVFMFDDTQIIKESFLEDVNGILNTGEVPNLFTAEELQETFSDPLFEKAMNEASVNTGNNAEKYSFFVRRCRENLHVVLCMSPIGDAFRMRLRFFPALVNCCTIDWFTEWPEEALRSVASNSLDQLEMPDNVRKGLIEVCVNMQELVRDLSVRYRVEMRRHFYVTPTSYLELIATFRGLLNSQRTEVLEAKHRYDNGLEKIFTTQQQVDVMQKELIDLQPLLKEATINTDALIVQIDKDTIEANAKKKVVEADEVVCKAQAEEANTIKASCEQDLSAALPALEGAMKALKSLSKGDIVEVKAMGKPPGGVKLTMEACCLMFGIKAEKVKDEESGKKVDDYWGPAKKKLLGDPKFLDNLVDYDKDNMDPDMVVKVTKFCEREDFTPEAVKKGSVAAAGVCKWVHAMMKYDDISKKVGPKKLALAAASESLAKSTAMLAEKQAVLKEVLDKLQVLQDGLDEAQAKKTALAKQVDDCSKKLVRAEQLISGLGGERDRWTEFSAKLGEKYENVTGDIMLSAGVVAYLGSFVSSYREEALGKWAGALGRFGITCSNPFSLRETLGDEVQVRGWVIDKLPNDAVSIENAIMLQRSNRWPLMIDPQGQANRWIKNLEGKNEDLPLRVVKQSMPNFTRVIEGALQYGNPVLMENVMESIDPVLEPVLLKQLVYVGGSATIKLGDATVDYDPNFKMYLTTKLRNPHYPPEVCVKVNLLNFMATSDGLEDQMQGIVVAKEEAALETLRERLVLEDAENKAALKQIEDKILYLLKNSTGNILDDEVLINTLGESKVKSNIIEVKVAEAAKTQVVIAKTRQGYKPVAFHASILFFCIADLMAIDPMYQYSLDWFITLFQQGITQAEAADPLISNKDDKLKDRMEKINSTVDYLLYVNVSRSLFEKDKLLFSFLLTTKLMLGNGNLSMAHLRFLLQGNSAVDLPKPNPCPDWLPQKCWGDLLLLETVEGFSGLLDTVFLNQLKKWRPVMDSTNPADEIAKLAKPLTSDPFKLMCIVRAMRPDFVVPEVKRFISNELDDRFISPPPLNVRDCYDSSVCNMPLIFVLTPGADPMTELIKVANSLDFGATMKSISLGQGQGPLAEEAITIAQQKGLWVCLQNCHLSVSWLPTLERICEALSPERVHTDFRLWLTSEPSPHFPAYVLQNGVKMTVEPPKGMRASLTGSWFKIEESWLESCAKPSVFKKLLFALTFLHATVIERRKFGPLGWNVKYVFSGPDMSICMDQLKIFLDDLPEGNDIPYAALAYLAGECNYGGRCTDDKDRRCLVNTISEFYSPKVLDDAHRFSPSGLYYAPPIGDLESYRDYIKSLPFSEGPELFGLHDNANISCALTETSELLGTMQSLQPQTGGGGGKSWDEVLLELAVEYAAKIPEKYDIEMALLDFPVRYDECMNTVLVQELIRFNRVIGTVASSLKEVQRAVKGLVVMSGELEAMGNNMVNGKVPVGWGKVSYPSLKGLGAWVKDFLERLDFLRDWFESKKPPSRYWVSGFFFTQAFITGTLQNFARTSKIPIDQTDFDFRVLTPSEEEAALTEGPDNGAFLWGLFMEGARWNVEEHVLDESHPRVLFIPMAHFHLWPRAKRDIPAIEGRIELYTGTPSGTAHVYNCPVYKTSERKGVLLTTGHSTNFVMMVRIPMSSRHEQIHWVKRGVAMLTGLDD